MKGIIEVEFIKIGNTDFKLVETDVKVQEEFRNNWSKITVLMRKMLEDFYRRYKIKIKISEKIDITSRKE